jgi:hypothetical protein
MRGGGGLQELRSLKLDFSIAQNVLDITLLFFTFISHEKKKTAWF